VLDHDKDGRQGLFVRVKFSITLDGNQVQALDDDYKLVIEENGRTVKVVDVPRPVAPGDLSVILALDTSGSMKEHHRMPQAQEAARTFLSKLPATADCGLILFDHEIRQTLDPVRDRTAVIDSVRKVQPRGGTAYLDAAFRGVQMLGATPAHRDRALVVMTDGVDINSTRTIEAVIAEAKKQRARVYTVGIGEPGKFEQVSTTLVLDHSGSMQPPADDADTTPKIRALHTAAARFVDSMSHTGRVSLIPFSTRVGTPREFSNNKFKLKSAIEKLVPSGETALLDAVHTAVGVLEADGARGKRAVVAMTDGIDNTSRRRVGEVVERAKEAHVPLYLLGFGRQNELDDRTMREMADATGGKFYHARNKDALVEIFENLSIELHDDGIDEESLTRLAKQTGGQYFPAKNVADLKLILERVTKTIQKETYEVVYASPSQRKAGDQRNVALKLVRRGSEGETVVQQQISRYQTHGLLVAEMNHLVYLGLLGALGALIILPAVLHRSGVTP
jgi:VWFA-related protein